MREIGWAESAGQASDAVAAACRRGLSVFTRAHRSPTWRTLGDLADHVVVVGDTGERDEVHDPLLRPAAHRMCETRLAKTAGTDDRCDTGRRQQVGHRGDVIVAAEQWVGLVRDAVPDRGPGVALCSNCLCTAWSGAPGSVPRSSRNELR
jgi:hypothetical protein